MKKILLFALTCAFLGLFHQSASAQGKFLQNVLLSSGDSVAINFTEVRYVTGGASGSRIGYGKPIQVYYTSSSFSTIVSASCGNLLTFIEYRNSGGTDTIALNPKWIKSASAVSGEAKTRLFVDEYPNRRIVSGSFWYVSGLLGACVSGTGNALTSNPLSQFAATTSAQLAGVISNETGSGLLVFGTSPVLTTPNLGTPSAAVLTNATGLPATGLSGYITNTASLDFTSTATLTSADLTITLTGAAVGDALMLGAANASVVANSSFSAWVSATNTVTVRFNNYSAGSLDPAAGTFRVSILK